MTLVFCNKKIFKSKGFHQPLFVTTASLESGDYPAKVVFNSAYFPPFGINICVKDSGILAITNYIILLMRCISKIGFIRQELSSNVQCKVWRGSIDAISTDGKYICISQPQLPCLEAILQTYNQIIEVQHGIVDSEDPYFKYLNARLNKITANFQFRVLFRSTMKTLSTSFPRVAENSSMVDSVEELLGLNGSPKRLDSSKGEEKHQIYLSLQYNLDKISDDSFLDKSKDPLRALPMSLIKACKNSLTENSDLFFRLHPLFLYNSQLRNRYCMRLRKLLNHQRVYHDGGEKIDYSSYELHITYCSACVYEFSLFNVKSMICCPRNSTHFHCDEWFSSELKENLAFLAV